MCSLRQLFSSSSSFQSNFFSISIQKHATNSGLLSNNIDHIEYADSDRKGPIPGCTPIIIIINYSKYYLIYIFYF